jgi:hypothetical protein
MVEKMGDHSESLDSNCSAHSTLRAAATEQQQQEMHYTKVGPKSCRSIRIYIYIYIHGTTTKRTGITNDNIFE